MIYKNDKFYIAELDNGNIYKYNLKVYGNKIGKKLAKLSDKTDIYYKNYIKIKDDYAIMYIYSNIYGIKEVKIDIDDIGRVQLYKWRITSHPSWNTEYCINSHRVNGEIKNLKLHRFVCNCEDSSIFIDHKNRNGLDNRKKNLRNSNFISNGKNSRSQKNKKDKDLPTGVYYYNDKGGYFRAFWMEGKKYKGSKNFKVKTLGYDNAKRAAIDCRYDNAIINNYDVTELLPLITRHKLNIKRKK